MPRADELIEQWGDYRGAMPRPADFDEFWSARMAEAEAVALSYDVAPAAGMPEHGPVMYLDLWFEGMEGARLHARYLRPAAADADVPLVLQFHGYPGTSRSWLEQGSFVAAGMAVIAFDCPGQGGPGRDVGGYEGTTVAGHIVAGVDGGAKNLYYTRLHQDIRILCRIVRELPGIDLARVFVNGASQGGGLGIAACALNADLVARAAILYPFLSDYRLVWELGADEIAYEGIRYYARWFDAYGERLDEVFGVLSYIDSKNFASLVRCPVLFGTGTADGVCPPGTQFAVYNALECPKSHHFFEGFGHEEIQEFDDMIVPFFAGCDAGGGWR